MTWTIFSCSSKKRMRIGETVRNSTFRTTLRLLFFQDPPWFKLLFQCLTRAFLVAQTVKRLPTMGETRVRSLGRKDPLEKETATHSSILAWKIPWTDQLGRLQAIGAAESRTRLSDFTFTFPLPTPGRRWRADVLYNPSGLGDLKCP